MDKIYYETVKTTLTGETSPDGIDYKGSCIVTEHETFEAAEQYANTHDCETIEEIGGSWDTYKKCWSCGEWFPEYELNRYNGTCERCEISARDHGF